MSSPITRRIALFRIGTSAVAATATAAIAAPTAAPEETGPITPDEFLTALTAIGWRHVAGFHFTKAGGVHRMGVIEYYDHEARASTKAADEIERIRLMQRVGKSGPDFWQRVGDRLWDLGKRENVLPDYPPSLGND